MGLACGDEDLGHQKAASRRLVYDGRTWESTRLDGVRLSCHMERDGSRGRVAQLWLMVVASAPSGYAVQPADFERGTVLLEAAVSRAVAHLRALGPPAVGRSRGARPRGRELARPTVHAHGYGPMEHHHHRPRRVIPVMTVG